jgi:hypothetical protein
VRQRSDRPRPAERLPTRVPGEGGIALAQMAGDLQLTPPRKPGTPRPIGRRVATAEQRERIFEPTETVPVSGVYDVVDRHGDCLGFQITCHADEEFPPTRAVKAHTSPPPRDEEIRVAYGYKLAYEAAHLQGGAPPPETSRHAGRIFRPGDPVPVSGIYGVVDETGTYLHHQRACIEHRHADDRKPTDESPEHRHVFPPIAGSNPDAVGYVLQYEARHLSNV